MSYVDRDRTSENVTGFVVSGLIIAAVSYALISGLAYSGIKNVIKKVTTVDGKEEKPKETPPPPPPKKIEMPPPVAPPVKVNIAVAPPVIQTVQTPPPAPPPVIVAAPPAPRFTPKSAQPKGNPANWATTDDYPGRALREERQGVTGFRVSVGTDGRVTSCEITSSSGTPELDSTTCTLVTRRARFTPGTDGEGQPTASSYSGRIRWQIPKD